MLQPSYTCKLKLDEETAKDVVGVSLKGKDISVKVKELEKVETFDAFAFLEITYTGISPNGSASIRNLASDGNLAKLNFSADRTNGLANGDTITVTVNSANNANYMIELFGALPESKTKKYTVSGLSAYVSKLEEISSDCYVKMKGQGEDLMRARAAGWVDYTDLHALDHDTGADFDYYWYAKFHNVMILADGTVSVDLTDTEIPGHGGWFTSGEDFKRGGLSYRGYEDLDTMFNKKVTQFVGEWNYENTVN